MKTQLKIVIIGSLALLFSCSPIAKNTITKKIGDSSKIGVDEYKKGNLAAARLFFEQGLKDAYTIDSVPDMINVLQNLTEIYLKMEDYTNASNAIFTAIRLSQEDKISDYDFSLQLSLGKYYDKSSTDDTGWNLAQLNYQKALDAAKKDEDKAMVYNSIGISKLRQNKLDEASNWILKSSKINESQHLSSALADNYYNLGDISDKKGNFPEALDSYLNALKNDKDAENSTGILEDLKKVGQTYLKLGQKDKAVYYLTRALNTAQSLLDQTSAAQINDLLKQASN